MWHTRPRLCEPMVPHIGPVLADVGDVEGVDMERAYLLIAGVLTGAGVGLITGDFTSWLAVGAVMGLALCAMVRPPAERREMKERIVDSQKLRAKS